MLDNPSICTISANSIVAYHLCYVHPNWYIATYSHAIPMLRMKVATITLFFFFFQAEDGIRDLTVTGVQTCALPISFRFLPPSGTRLRSNGMRRLVPPSAGLKQHADHLQGDTRADRLRRCRSDCPRVVQKLSKFRDFPCEAPDRPACSASSGDAPTPGRLPSAFTYTLHIGDDTCGVSATRPCVQPCRCCSRSAAGTPALRRKTLGPRSIPSRAR